MLILEPGQLFAKHLQQPDDGKDDGAFYEAVFEFRLVDLEVGDGMYPCFPNKNGDGFSGALVQYDFTQPGKQGRWCILIRTGIWKECWTG